ncbi:X-Pro dipeptidyl-peptidase [Saccharothrix coeruleofusca]|uniref:CocE/NonD family hydrolase n=1 Tax=Saccharothrix coeruleofusca TaxID=33919 RepID=UPI001AE9B797|nr:CocE/NonD family hydrolase [Saccharothrix coeruleofusca]MBP2338851.1 X-Pro dipeptidyl-peptidase [Saccharothrix coeruleofusca]
MRKHAVPRRTGAISLAVVATLVLAGQSPAAAAGPPTLSIIDNETQPVFSYADAIVESLSVETGEDTDGDGVVDHVYVDLMRPREGEQGLKSPVLLTASPYNEGYENPENEDIPLRQAIGAGPGFAWRIQGDVRTDLFVPRGYAVAQMQVQGTGRSTGCTDLGGPHDIAAVTAVINWFAGSGRAFYLDGSPATADWSTGAVGMYGHSYDGTLQVGAASTGVPALKAIVPTAPVADWYKWVRTNGLTNYWADMPGYAQRVAGPAAKEVCAGRVASLAAAEDAASGDRNAFWDAHDYVRDMSRFTAPVLTTWARDDANVDSVQFADLWNALGAKGVPRKLWLLNGHHGSSPSDWRYDDWKRTLRRWMDRWLLGLDNGIDREPAVDAQRQTTPGPGTPPEIASTWPRQDATPVRLHAGDMVNGSAPLTTEPSASADFHMVRDTKVGPLLKTQPGIEPPYRIFGVTPPAAADTRFSGTPTMTATVRPTTRSTPLSAYLVTYREGVKGMKVLSRGLIDLKNRHSLYRPEPLVPGETLTVTWEMSPLDQTVPAGQRIGLILLGDNYSSDTVPDPEAGPIDFDLTKTSITVPVVGGRAALTL